MSGVSKLTIGVIVVGLAIFSTVAQLVSVRQTQVSHTAYTTNAGQLVSGSLVGQTFVSEEDNLSGIGVLMATYSNRPNKGTVELHVQMLTAFGQDIRVAKVDAADIRDNQIQRFTFDPISASAGVTYFFFVVAPQSVEGSAVTVDLDTRDPYHRGSAYVVRDKGVAVQQPAVILASGKPTIDVAFQTYHTVSLRAAITHQTTSFFRNLIDTWPQMRSQYVVWSRVALQTVALLVGFILTSASAYEFLTRKGEKRFIILTLAGFFVLALGLRLMYAWQMPITYDEGNYLYDARTWLQGSFAGGDGYVKAPLVIAWVAMWEFILGNTVLAGRVASILASALTIYPVYLFTREINWPLVSAREAVPGRFSRRVGLMAAMLWATLGTAIVHGVYVHTQPLALFFGVSGLAILIAALRGTTPHLTFFTKTRVPSVLGWFVLAGVLLGLGVASRKSMLAVGLVPLLLILSWSDSWKSRARHLAMVAAGFMIVLALFGGFAWLAYGQVGIEEAFGINSAEDGITAVSPDEVEQVRAYSLRGMTPFFRESLPLILLVCLGLGVLGEQVIRAFFRREIEKPEPYIILIQDYVVPKLAWIVPWVVFWWAWSFFVEYEGQAFMFWGIPVLWYFFAFILTVFSLVPRRGEEGIKWAQRQVLIEKSQQPGFAGVPQSQMVQERRKAVAGIFDYTVSYLAVPLWLAGVIFFYINWIKFHANYLSEFILPLVIIAAPGALMLFERVRSSLFFPKDFPAVELLRRVGVGALAMVLIWSVFVSNYITLVFEHTGTFDQSSAISAAAWAKENIPAQEPIFTGAALIPYLSGHHVSLDIAHPRWYAYEFTRKDTRRLNTFLPEAELMVGGFKSAKWFLLDEQTRFSFFMEYDHIKAEVEREFVPVQSFDNLSNTLTFYKRK